MAVKIRLTNKSQGTRQSTSSSGDTLVMSRSVYQQLGSLVKNKELNTLYASKTIPDEYIEFLDRMNELMIVRSAGEAIPARLEPYVKIDEYLGGLGVEQDYPYSKDYIELPNWLEGTGVDEYRILVDESDNTYLTDNNGSEILVSYIV